MSNWKKGTKLNKGKYIIESILLRSGYGLFYRAKDTINNKLVTINATNIFWQKQDNATQLEQKYLRQAKQIAQKCQNPYIVTIKPKVYFEQNQVYMVTDYPEGVNLATYIDSNGKLPSDEALNIITKIASALNVLHQNKTIHQDIKPQSIIIDSETQNPMLVNYGMSIKLFAPAYRRNAQTLNDCFIPPEQLQAKKKLGIGSDIYCLAATLYALSTGQLPICAHLRTEQDVPLPPPKQLNPSLSKSFNRAILEGMELDLKQRPHYLKDWLDLFKEEEEDELSFASINELPTNLSDIPIKNLAILDAVVTNDDTMVQKSKKNFAPPSIINRKNNYPSIESFTFETVTIEEQKELFGFISKQKKKLISTEGQFFVEYLGEAVNLDMVFIPAGSFVMGSAKNDRVREKNESPQHLVNLNSLYVSKYPITQLQWKVVSRFPKITRNLKQKPSFFKGDNLPVERISWLDAQEFCSRLSKYTGRNYRLPTESEWEYSCRANTKTTYFFGDAITPELANYDAEKNRDAKGKNQKIETKKTTPVDNYFPNGFGLYDCHGNVWEWCEDHYVDNYNIQPQNGSAYYSDVDNPERVVRGGSWSLPDSYCRSAKRNGYIADSSYNFIGFRVVCVLD